MKKIENIIKTGFVWITMIIVATLCVDSDLFEAILDTLTDVYRAIGIERYTADDMAAVTLLMVLMNAVKNLTMKFGYKIMKTLFSLKKEEKTEVSV